MSLLAGARLGPYEIVAPLGSGGMGEVYKARDPRLNRLIAIKVLPDEAANDPERRGRFEREAQAVAALNHPNIVTIHSVEEAEGLVFLTMELVQGRTLSEALPRAGLALDHLLKIAIPVADAVAAAHQKGITHRDLKPANIMLGEGDQAGRIKVLDFGLAKLTDRSFGAGMHTTALPTAAATGEGRILGTVAYMSPEQAEGKAVDARSDLFSLGVVLYEMATGQRPFTGDTSISILSSILKDTPKPVTEVNAALPPEFGRIVRHALMKDPERRYQSAKDLRNELEELDALAASGTPIGGATGVSRPKFEAVFAWRWAALGMAAVAVASMVALGVIGGRGSPPESPSAPPVEPVSPRAQTATPPAPAPPQPASAAPEIRPTAPPVPAAAPQVPSAAAQMQMVPLTSAGNTGRPAISPDGKYVAYVQVDDRGETSVWLRQVATNSNVQIVAPVPGTPILGLTFTADGSFVDLVRSTRTLSAASLWRVPFFGGEPRRLVDAVASAPAWSPDGRQMAFVTARTPAPNASPAASFQETSVVVADADGSSPRVVATRRLPRAYDSLQRAGQPDVRPVWLPDGKTLAVTGVDDSNGNPVAQLIALNIATGAETITRLRSEASGLAIAPDGRSFTISMADDQGRLQLHTLRTPGGQTARLTSDLSEYAGASRAGDVLVTERRESRSSLWIADAAGNGARQIGRDAAGALGHGGLAWGAGSRLIYAANLPGGSGLWSTDLAGGAADRLIVPGGGSPSTSTDGRTLVFDRFLNGRQAVWRAEGDGTRATEVAPGFEPVVTADGFTVVYNSRQSGAQTAWTIDLRSGGPRQFSQLPSRGRPDVSPDARFVMLGSTAIFPVGGGTVLRFVFPAAVPGILPHWTPDGTGMAYLDAYSGSNIWVQPLDGGPERQLTHFTDGRRIVAFAWSPDGKLLAVARALQSSDLVLVRGVP